MLIWIIALLCVKCEERRGVVQRCILRCVKQSGSSGPREDWRVAARPNTSTAYFVSTPATLLVAEGGGWTVPVGLWGQQGLSNYLACTHYYCHLNLSIYHQSSVVRVFSTALYIPQLPSLSSDIVQAQNICDWMKCAVNEFE